MTPDPITSAAHWLDAACGDEPIPSLLIVVGIDQGHLLDVLDMRGSTTKVLAIEPDRAMAGAFQARKDWHAWRTTGRLAHLVHPDYAGADEAWRMFPTNPNDCLLMVSPRLREGSPEATAAAGVAKKILYGVRANAEARRQFAPRYLTNTIRNLPAIVRGRDVRALAGTCAGMPAVIAGAGPSLDGALDPLREMKDRAVLIAVDTALRPLLHAGLTPRLAVGLDPSSANARHFHLLPECKETWLVGESGLDSSAVHPFGDRTFWFRVSNHHPWPWLKEHGVDVEQVDVWGSVLTAAFQVAWLAGCDPIITVGSDLAFTGGRPYCRGTTYEFDWAFAAASGTGPREWWQRHVAKSPPQLTTDLHGSQTTSTASLMSVRDWLVARAKRSGRRVINATGAGILFGAGVEQAELREVLSVVAPLFKPSRSWGDGSRATPSGLASEIRKVRQALDRQATSDTPLRQWNEFCGGGFDASATTAALDDAVTRLETTSAAPQAPAIPWSDLIAGQRGERFIELAELTERWLAASKGEALRSPSAEAADTLVDALGLLGQIKNGVLEREVLVPLSHIPVASSPPVATLYGWPEGIRWAVQMFEALLGRSCGSILPGESVTFFNQRLHVRGGAARPATAEESLGATHAITLLAAEWFRCAISLMAPGSAMPAINRLTGLASAVRHNPPVDRSIRAATLAIRAETPTSSQFFELPLHVDAPGLARVLTGFIHTEAARTIELASLDVSGLRASMAIQFVGGLGANPGRSSNPDRARAVRPILVTPRVLTDEGVAPAILSYANDRGAIAVVNHSTQSVLIHGDGTVATHQTWPRPIVAELPFGDEGGAVAWGNGLASLPDVTSAYVMYRRRSGDDVSVEDLPVRPVIGSWWKGRLHWCCYPGPAATWVGVASWMPGEQVRLELADLTLFGMYSDQRGLRLEPCTYAMPKGYDRQLISTGWIWRGEGAPDPVALGAHGSASSRCTLSGWTAVAHPNADLVTLASSDGRSQTLQCYYPLRAMWSGRSLLISTAHRELLLFQDLLDVLSETA